ncbi:MAG: quinone oxidoreductase [Hyphomicrobiales bacterium]|nr:quinone oxidoreductase [Hyphomicrobiales bacterium]
MRAMGIRAFGCADRIEPLSLEIPTPGEGEVLVRLTRSGVNFIDVYMRTGVYQRSDTYKTPLPMVLGMEGAGVVETVGKGVCRMKPGDRVAFSLTRGSYADYICVPAWKVAIVPRDISDDIAASLMLQGATAHYLTHSAYPVKEGDRCLVHAAAGGVGQLLVQLAKARGAEVFATVGSPEKAEIAKARGADHIIFYRHEDFRRHIMEATGGEGVSVAYDSVGKDTIARSIRSLKRRGTCVLFGASSGVVEAVEPLELAEAGSVFLTRPHLADYMASGEEISWRVSDLFKLVQSGHLHVTIDRSWPLDKACDAHRALETRTSRGKLLLKIS